MFLICVELPLKKYRRFFHGTGSSFDVLTGKTCETHEGVLKFWFSPLTWGMDYDFRKSNLVAPFEEKMVFLIRRCLKKWNLDVPLDIEGEELNDKSMREVGLLPASMMRDAFSKFYEKQGASKNLLAAIDRDSTLLFGKNGRVYDAMPETILYCKGKAFWAKFGISLEDLRKMSVEEVDVLKQYMENENEAEVRKSKESSPKGTMITGAGGRPKFSRGIVVDRG